MSRPGVVAVVNPVARGAHRMVDLLQARLAGLGRPPALVWETEADSLGGPQARDAVRQGAELVLAGGGDGTVRAVAEQLRRTEVPLGVLPLGTANIFARNLGLSPSRPGRCVEVALSGNRRALDVGVATLFPPAGVPAEHLFFVLAGMGRDAETVRAVDPRVKARLGWPVYFVAGLGQMLAEQVPVQVSLDDAAPRPIRVWSYLVGNSGRVPGGLRLFPGARLDDGLLRTLEVHVDRPSAWLRIALEGSLRRAAVAPGMVHGSAHRVRLQPDQPLVVQLDGDVFGPVARAEFRVDPGSLLVMSPEPRQEPEENR